MTTDADLPSAEDLARLQSLAGDAAQAAQQSGSVEDKTDRVQSVIKEKARVEFPALSDKQLDDLASRLAPVVVAMTVAPLTDAMIERMQELDVVFTPGQAPAEALTTPEAQQAAESAAAGSVPDEAPRRKSWAERFAGR